MYWAISLAVLLVSAVSAGPARNLPEKCALKCSGNEKILYHKGYEYHYKFEGNTTTKIAGRKTDIAETSVAVNVILKRISDCDFTLHLNEAVLGDGEKSSEFSRLVSENGLIFSFDDGTIDQICGSEDEPVWVMNFKKSILSHLQNSVDFNENRKTVVETDVNGECETTYMRDNLSDMISIIKTKQPSKCAQSFDRELSIFGFPGDSLAKGLRPLSSSQTCNQEFHKSGLIRETSCLELHEFSPFNDNAEASTTASTKLSLLHYGSPQFNRRIPDSFSKRSTLEFESVDEGNSRLKTDDVRTILRELEIASENDLRKRVSELFSHLHDAFYHLTVDQIQQLISENRGTVFIRDALKLVHTPESVEVFADLINKGDVSDKEVQSWLVSLALIKDPTMQIITALMPLSKSFNSGEMLAISSLIYKHCSKYEDCQNKPAIQEFLREVQAHLGTGCRVYDETEENKILLSLKVIGNTGQIKYIEDSLIICYKESNSIRVRVAAIEAWRRTSCDDSREHLLDIFDDTNLDNEIRAAAYLELVKCPTRSISARIQNRLLSEDQNEITSFVYSHLYNIKENEMEYDNFEAIFNDENIAAKFKETGSKFSRNFWSTLPINDEIKADVKSNVLFSSSSLLPRSSNLNLNVDLFGQKINLFEIGLRAENLEAYIEHFFGPDGYYSDDVLSSVIKNLRKKSTDENELENFIPQRDKTDLDLHVKLFGNELLHKNINDLQNLVPNFKGENIFDILRILMAQKSIDFVKNYNFIKSELTYPTITGFPITLSLDGHLNLALKMNGNLNIENFASVNVQGMFMPSANLRLESQIVVDQYLSKSGVQVISNIETSTGIEGKIKVQNGKLIEIEAKLPEDNKKIFEMSNDVNAITNNYITPVVSDTDNDLIEWCTSVNGLKIELCHLKTKDFESKKLSLFRPYINGIYFKKTDPRASAYVLRISDQPNSFVFLYEITGLPETQYKIEIERKVEDVNVRKFLIRTPKFSYMGELKHQYLANKLLFTDVTVMKNDISYNAGLRYEKITQADVTIITSKVYVIQESPSSKNTYIKHENELVYDAQYNYMDGKFSSEGTLVNPISLKGNYDFFGKKASFSMESIVLDVEASGKIEGTENDSVIRLHGKYSRFGLLVKEINPIITYSKDVIDVNTHSHSGSIEIKELNMNADFKYSRDVNGLSSSTSGKCHDFAWNYKADMETSYKLVDDFGLPNFISRNFRDSTKKYKSSLKLTKGPSILVSQDISAEKDDKGLYTLKIFQNTMGSTRHMLVTVDPILFGTDKQGSIFARYSQKAGEEEDTQNYELLWTAQKAFGKFVTNLNLDLDGLKKHMLFSGSLNKLEFNTNIYADVNVFIENDRDSFGRPQTSAYATVRYGPYKYKFNANLDQSKFKAHLQLNPNQVFLLEGSYSLIGSHFSSQAVLETPFALLKKQVIELDVKCDSNKQNRRWKGLLNIKFPKSTLSSYYIYNGKDNSIYNKFNIKYNHLENNLNDFDINMLLDKAGSNIIGNIGWMATGCSGSYNLETSDKNVMTKLVLDTIRYKKIVANYEQKLDDVFYVIFTLNVPSANSEILFSVKQDMNFDGQLLISTPCLPKMSLSVSTSGNSQKQNILLDGYFNDFVINAKSMIEYTLDTNNKDLITYEIDVHYGTDVNEDESKNFNIVGSILGDDIEARVTSNLYENLRINSIYNRSKRSLDFQMMNDHHHGGVISNFNELKIVGKTPYSRAKDIHLEIKRNPNGWSIDYKRNENKVFFEMSAESDKKAMQIKINSEIPGWEFLALAGRIDLKEVVLYLKGERESQNMKITGNGQLGKQTGSLTIKTTSPYKNYESVTTKIEYNSLRNIFIFDSKSDDGNYKIKLQAKKKLSIDVLVPHSEANTVITGELTPFKGNFKMTSRFVTFKTFSIDYNVQLGPKITATFEYERNGQKIVELDFMRDSKENIGHLEIHGRRGENHSHLHLHREGWKSLEYSFERNGKKIVINMKGEGDLPNKGTVTFNGENSFREIPRTVEGKITIDRTKSPKEITVNVNYDKKYNYDLNLKYNADLKNKRKGDFVFTLKQDRREPRAYDNVSGKWDLTNKDNINIELKVEDREYKITGKLGMKEGDLLFKSTRFNNKEYFAKWKFVRQSTKRDYFLKLGREGRYIMLKLKGTIKDIFNGNVEGAMRISRFMQNDFEYTVNWKRNAKGLSGKGNFKYGEYSGTHNLINLKRNAKERAAVIRWEAKTNIENYKNIKVNGEYSLSKRKIDLKASTDKDEFSIKGELSDFTLKKSNNLIDFHFPKYGKGKIEMSHDFTDPMKRSVSVVIKGPGEGKDIEYIAKWSRNKDLSKFNLEGHIHSKIIGDVDVKAMFDIEDMKNAKASLMYKRNNNKHININWSRVRKSHSLKSTLLFESHFAKVQEAKIYLDASWKDEINVKAGIIYSKKIEFTLKATKTEATATLTTPYEPFKEVTAKSTYKISKEETNITFDYTRGDRKITGSVQVLKNSPNDGSISIKIATPFEKFKTLEITGELKNGEFVAKYKRNDVEIDVKGKATIKTGNSGFDVAFTLPSGKKVELLLEYDVINFIKGTGSTPKTILKNKVNVEGKEVEFSIKGYRTSEKIYLEIDGSSSFSKLKTFYIKLDSELNLSKREGQFIAKVNDFSLDMKNTFERLPNGYYAKSHIESTLTDLPGLTLGLGRDGESFIFTVGYGNNREVSVTMNGKNHFKDGISGTIDIPHRKIHDLEYDVTYNFPSDDILHVDLKVKLPDGKAIEGSIHYDSHGVKTRLTS